jgi:menaquinone-dependent protoporphyrinogen oxidase
MNVLVTAASKHGATHGIAEHVAKTLIDRGFHVDLTEPRDVGGLEPYDAVILLSAVYAGNWRPEAKDFAVDRGPELRGRRVWLVSSGPLGEEDPNPTDLPLLDQLMEATGAVSHTWFAGKLDKDELSFGERAIVKVVKAPYGDFREWDEIERWADEVAAELTGG